MIDTGGTITKAADALFEAGAADVIVAATHAVLSGPAVDRLKNSRVSEVVVTDTLPDRRREAVRQAHRPVDRTAAGPRHPRGLRRRLGDQPVRRAQLTRGASSHCSSPGRWAPASVASWSPPATRCAGCRAVAAPRPRSGRRPSRRWHPRPRRCGRAHDLVRRLCPGSRAGTSDRGGRIGDTRRDAELRRGRPEPAVLEDGVFIGPAAVASHRTTSTRVAGDPGGWRVESPDDWTSAWSSASRTGAAAAAARAGRAGRRAASGAGAVVGSRGRGHPSDCSAISPWSSAALHRVAGWVGRAGDRRWSRDAGDWVGPRPERYADGLERRLRRGPSGPAYDAGFGPSSRRG